MSVYPLKKEKKCDNNTTKRLEDGYRNELSEFNTDNLKGIKRVEIGNGNYKTVTQFVIDGLNELETIIIRKNCFKLHYMKRGGSKCLIMNCDQLREIHIGEKSFELYESFELKNLPSLISIQFDSGAFMEIHSIVFESMNDWMNDEWDLFRLQSIILGKDALDGDDNTIRSNELIMKSMNDDNWLMRSSFSIYIQRIFQILFYRQSGIG